jgi:hypothetical protein
MFIWGGYSYSAADTFYGDGATYNPSGAAVKSPTLAANTWAAVASAGALSARSWATAVVSAGAVQATSAAVIIWGGEDSTYTPLNDGAIWQPLNNPVTGSWTAVTTTNAPTGRVGHSATWDSTNSRMYVWGGYTASGYTNTGAYYNPNTNTWTTMSTTNAPEARAQHNAVWTGTYLIVYGGLSYVSSTGTWTLYSDGGYYDPSNNTWGSLSNTNAPSGRYEAAAAWTGTYMLIWGGSGFSTVTDAWTFDSNGSYYTPPGTNSWNSAMTTTNAPAASTGHAYTWDGAHMYITGGFLSGAAVNYVNQFTP